MQLNIDGAFRRRVMGKPQALPRACSWKNAIKEDPHEVIDLVSSSEDEEEEKENHFDNNVHEDVVANRRNAGCSSTTTAIESLKRRRANASMVLLVKSLPVGMTPRNLWEILTEFSHEGVEHVSIPKQTNRQGYVFVKSRVAAEDVLTGMERAQGRHGAMRVEIMQRENLFAPSKRACPHGSSEA
ncbi:hypothetical protein AC1031_003527 [Aphanomyces cochlioides]|nr:hypothetical protein AC1031_003527 [Aphanomyces cochlioides]